MVGGDVGGDVVVASFFRFDCLGFLTTAVLFTLAASVIFDDLSNAIFNQRF